MPDHPQRPPRPRHQKPAGLRCTDTVVRAVPSMSMSAAAVLAASVIIALLLAACDSRPGSAAMASGRTAASAQPSTPGQAAEQRGDAARGKLLLTQYQCGSCHAIPDIPAARGIRGPSLAAFGKRSYIAGRIPHNADMLAQWIVAPASLVPDTTMPAMGVTMDEARDMAAYLDGLQ